MGRLVVTIWRGDEARRFEGEGTDVQIAVAFRNWLASGELAAREAEDADRLDRESIELNREIDQMEAAVEEIRRRDAEDERRRMSTPKALAGDALETVWSGVMEREGKAPGLSGPVASSLGTGSAIAEP